MRMNWKIVSAMATAMALGVVLTLAIGQAQPRTATLTPQDYIDIQQLLARYSDALDTCSNDGYDYADLYVPDGVYIDLWSNVGVKEGGIKWAGREKLAEAAGGGPLDWEDGRRQPLSRQPRHHAVAPRSKGQGVLALGAGPHPSRCDRGRAVQGRLVRRYLREDAAGLEVQAACTHSRQESEGGVSRRHLPYWRPASPKK